MIYEYKTMWADTPPPEQQMNDFGAAGWALVAMLPHKHRLLLYFMRALGPNGALPPREPIEPEVRRAIASVRETLSELQEPRQ